MKDSGIEWIGKIPDNWNVLRNKYNFTLDKRLVGSAFADTQLLSLTKNGVKEISPEEQNGKVPSSFSTYQLVDKDDIVMCLFDLDASAVFSGISHFSGMISPAYKCFKCQDSLFPLYVDYYFRTVFVDRKYKRYAKNVRYSLNADEFLALPMLVPPKKEQIAIAYFLDAKCTEIDALTADIQSEIDTLQEYKRSVITEAVTKGLDKNASLKDSGTDWIGAIPSNWSVSKLGNVLTLRNERNYKPLAEVNLISLYTDRGVVQHADLEKTSGNIAQNADGYKIVHKNDIVVNIILAWMGAMGISDYDGVTSPAYDVYRINIDKIYPHYCHYILRSPAMAGECYRYGRGIMMMRWRTYSTEFKKIKIPLPTIEEQKKIADYLDTKCKEIEDIIAQKQEQLEVLADYKKSVIYEYVTGKKEVPAV